MGYPLGAKLGIQTVPGKVAVEIQMPRKQQILGLNCTKCYSLVTTRTASATNISINIDPD